MTLDIAKFLHKPLPARHPQHIFQSFLGRQIIDGVPFNVAGQAFLWGQTTAERREMDLPATFDGIRIGRTFDELHLIHHTRWPDVEGQTVAYVCLNYVDGSKYILPLRYGVHIRDWYRLPSEESGAMADPDTKICWRHPAVQYKSPIRVYKTTLANPLPQKSVDTMDIVSGRGLASYALVAATVSNRASTCETPRKFDGKITIRVLDGVTGKPIENALVEPSMNVDDEGVVAQPFRTSAAGEGTIRYPVALTTSIYASVQKKGYARQSRGWNKNQSVPGSVTIRLVPGDEGSRRR